MHGGIKIFGSIFLLLAGLLAAKAQSNAPPVHLAIVVEDPAVATMGDLLTAELSKADGLQLLERTEIERVYREQALSAANRDYVKLGQILGADGLLVLETSDSSEGKWMHLQLVAVKPGVLLASERFAWPLTNGLAWAVGMGSHLSPLLPKLSVLAKDAQPISVINLRSGVQSAESRELERQLTLLATERLSRERQLFVLERRKMQLMTAEKDLMGLNDSAFWDGAYLLDGVVDRNGYARDTVTISVRLIPPKGESPMTIEVAGSRTNCSEVINRLAGKIVEALKLHPDAKPWDPAQEAKEYQLEAEWALKWRLYPQAQAAAESAWALGKQDAELATLRIRAYCESVNPADASGRRINEGEFRREIVVPTVPDESGIESLQRSLELLPQNASLILGTNKLPSVGGYRLALQLIRKTVGLLTSYYNVAEKRVGREEQLAKLRSATRRAIETLDTYTPLVRNVWERSIVINARDHSQGDYWWLKWEECGLWCDKPEEELPQWRELLEAGYVPSHFPQLISWSWEDRKRVPALMHQFANNLRASTNLSLRLAGIHFAIGLAPFDGGAELPALEEELIQKLWAERQWLYRNAANASFLNYVETTLNARLEVRIDENGREGLAANKRRIRLDFLKHATEADLPVFHELFRFTSTEMASRALANEFLPLLEEYFQKLKDDPTALDMYIRNLQQVAGIPFQYPPTANNPLKQTLPPEEVLEARFIKWRLSRKGIEPNRIPKFYGMIVRGQRLWLQVRYQPEGGLWAPMDVQVVFLAVNPATGASEEIPFPAKFGPPTDKFDVSEDSLFASTPNHLYRYRFKEKNWEEIPAPMEGTDQLVWSTNGLFVGRADGLFHVNPESKEVKLLVSSRRQPPENEIDPLWTEGAKIYLRSDGKLGVLTDLRCFCLDPINRHWTIRPLPRTGTNRIGNHYIFASPGGSQWMPHGGMFDRYLVGYWNDDGPPESLLMEEYRPYGLNPSLDKVMKPVRWDWPKGFPLEICSIYAEDNSLWLLCPRKPEQYGPGVEGVKFSDNRQATIFFYHRDFPTPLSLAIHLENNGQTAKPLEPENAGFDFTFPWDLFWVKTEPGFVISAPAYCGHWLVPRDVLNTRFEAQRKIRSQSSTSTDAKLEAPAKP